MPAPTGIEKYALLILLVADRERASHVKITRDGTAAVIQLWRDGWVESDLTDRSYPFHLPLIRQLATMLSGTMPGQDQTLTGRFALEREGKEPLYILGAIDRLRTPSESAGNDHDSEVAAYLELVDELTYASGRAPRPPGAA